MIKLSSIQEIQNFLGNEGGKAIVLCYEQWPGYSIFLNRIQATLSKLKGQKQIPFFYIDMSSCPELKQQYNFKFALEFLLIKKDASNYCRLERKNLGEINIQNGERTAFSAYRRATLIN